MKKAFTLFLQTMLIGFLSAQQNLSGVVVDVTTQKSIEGVSITSTKNSRTISDANGAFEINANPEDSLLFTSIGYQPETISVSVLTRKRHNKVSLKPLTYNLKQVNIHSETNIHLSNPSFESLPGPSIIPKDWTACNFNDETPPDTQPGSFDVEKSAFHGYTYLGLVVTCGLLDPNDKSIVAT